MPVSARFQPSPLPRSTRSASPARWRNSGPSSPASARRPAQASSKPPSPPCFLASGISRARRGSMTASKLRIAFAIERLVPAGGLEQHALRLADLLAQRGHEVTLITTRAPATPPLNVAVREIPGRGASNHGRMAAFAEDAAAAAREFDRSLVFHPVPGFDVVFCANPSRAQPSPLRALLPRYRAYAELERQAFAPSSHATVLCLSSVQRDAIARNNATPAERLVLLPPTV